MNATDGSLLWQRAKQGDAEARRQIIEQNVKLVREVARRVGGYGDLEDLIQVGTIGLIKAVDRFDPGMGFQFSTYAVPLIAGEIRRYFRDHGPVKMSRSAQALARQAWACARRLSQELGREPSVGEIARALNAPVADLVEAMEASRPPAPIEDQRDSAVSSVERDIEAISVRHAVDELDPRERMVVLLRYLHDRTQEEVCRVVGCSQAQVSRLEKRALEKLRAKLSP